MIKKHVGLNLALNCMIDNKTAALNYLGTLDMRYHYVKV